MRRRMSLVVAAALSSAALGSVGCGASEGSDAERRALITDAAERTLDAGTAVATIEVSGEGQLEALSLAGELPTDFETEELQGAIDATLPEVGETEVEIYGRGLVTFGRYPEFLPPDLWVRLPSTPFDSLQRPSQLAGALEAAITEIEAEGQVSVDGEEYERYTAAYDFERSIDALPAAQQAAAQERLAALPDIEAVATIDIDGNGLLRRLAIGLDVGAAGDLELSQRFDDLGEPVSFDPPKPSQVTTFRELGRGGAAEAG